ncbi:hypothetical protein [Pallidibacillus pasinlerensis]|nr:hypothetical protein [Pallidibacillus pasinlerensis]
MKNIRIRTIVIGIFRKNDWKRISEFQRGKLRLVPEGLLELIKK